MEADKAGAGNATGTEICTHSVDILSLPEDTVRALKRAGIKQVGHLLAMTKEELKGKGIPPIDLSLTATALQELGLAFGTLASQEKV